MNGINTTVLNPHPMKKGKEKEFLSKLELDNLKISAS